MTEPKTPWNDRNALRDWFAGQALTAAYVDAAEWDTVERAASWAYSLAEAMLVESDKRRAQQRGVP